MSRDADVIIIGGGIAGMSLAARLADRARVILLESEALLCTHTTGRSAALFSETYGNAFVRELTSESRPFFEAPPAGFTPSPLLSPRPALFVARPGDVSLLEQSIDENDRSMRALTEAEALQRMPILRPDIFSAFAEEPGSMDIDVAALFDGFRRVALKSGVEIRTDWSVRELAREGDGWRVVTPSGAVLGAIVVNAAGAWAGTIGRLAGLHDRGLMPLRRTMIAFDPPEQLDVSRWMFVNDIGGEFYFKSDAGLVLASPADESPSEPCDAQPEEIDVATIAYRIEEATTMQVRSIRRRWAGLRTFAPDGSPIFEFDRDAEGFFWLAGQGGYGIQTAPAISSRAANAILERL